MIDLKEIRANPERLREIIRLRKVDTSRADLDRWLELDKQKRELQSSLEKLNGEKKKIARLGRTDPDAARSRGQELRQKSRELEAEISQITQEWQEILDWFPNLIHPEMPEGEGEDDNIEECAWIPGTGYLDSSQLGKGNHTASIMPQKLCHADHPDFT
ncbi:hypothetical protein IH992_31955, partial [Candidatus Poribacteria bacterium]|nr:hypothetical protein [Candidatus Poribacteria bacterium]